MLIITAVLIGETDGICKYEVRAAITKRKNDGMPTPIWVGTVDGHQRSQGWAVLAGHIARKAGLQSKAEQRTIEQSLDYAVGELAKCPVCGRILKVIGD